MKSAGLPASTFGLPRHSLEDVQAKETPIGYAAIILNYRNVEKHLWRDPQIIKFENAFHIWINIGYICEHTLSAVSRVNSRFRVRLLQLTITTSLCCYSFRAEFHKIGQLPTASGVLLIVSRIIYLFK